MPSGCQAVLIGTVEIDRNDKGLTRSLYLRLPLVVRYCLVRWPPQVAGAGYDRIRPLNFPTSRSRDANLRLWR